MDSNNDPFDGCETEIREAQCDFGGCGDHAALENVFQRVCGANLNLQCGPTGCCDCAGEIVHLGSQYGCQARGFKCSLQNFIA